MCPGRRLGLGHLARDGAQAPPGLLGIHVNMPATVPPDDREGLTTGDPRAARLSPRRRARSKSLDSLYKKGTGYAAMMVTRPQTLGYGI